MSMPTADVRFEPNDDDRKCPNCGRPAKAVLVVNDRTDGSVVCEQGTLCAARGLARFSLRSALPYHGS